MSADYTLPPLPEWAVMQVNEPRYLFAACQMKTYGQQCAEAARAPLLAANAALSARIAELEAAYRGLDAYKRALSSRVAELEAQLALAQADGPDAKRYRWLASESRWKWSPEDGVALVVPGWSLALGDVKAQCDAAVDAAMNKGSEADRESGDA